MWFYFLRSKRIKKKLLQGRKCSSVPFAFSWFVPQSVQILYNLKFNDEVKSYFPELLITGDDAFETISAFAFPNRIGN